MNIKLRKYYIIKYDQKLSFCSIQIIWQDNYFDLLLGLGSEEYFLDLQAFIDLLERNDVMITGHTINIQVNNDVLTISRADSGVTGKVKKSLFTSVLVEYQDQVADYQKNLKAELEWNGIPTDPEYFKDNSIDAMYYQPETGQIGRYDLKNNRPID